MVFKAIMPDCKAILGQGQPRPMNFGMKHAPGAGSLDHLTCSPAHYFATNVPQSWD